MAWKELAPPTVPAVSTAFAKLHARVLTTAEDDLVALYVNAATRAIEAETRRVLIKRQYLYVIDRFPAEDSDNSVIELPIAPLVSIDDVSYIEIGTGALVSWPTANYATDAIREPGRIQKGLGVIWPIVQPSTPNVGQITFTAGYAEDSDDPAIPEPLRAAICILASHWYNVREPVALERYTAVEIPKTYQYLVDSFKMVSI